RQRQGRRACGQGSALHPRQFLQRYTRVRLARVSPLTVRERGDLYSRRHYDARRWRSPARAPIKEVALDDARWLDRLVVRTLQAAIGRVPSESDPPELVPGQPF